MSRIDELMAELCPNGIKYLEIGSVVNYEQPTKYIVDSTDYDDNYEIPVLTAGQTFILGYTDETDGIFNATKDSPVIIFDDFTGAFKWVDFPFKVKSSAMKILTANENKAMLRYIYHIMGHIGFSSSEHKRLWISIYSAFKIPMPPLEVQREIVRVLDNFTDLTAELTAELTARKKQYEYYRDLLLDFGVHGGGTIECEWHTIRLGDICSIITKGTTPKSYEKTGIAFIKTEAFVGRYIDKSKLSFVSEETHIGFLKRSILRENDILFTIAGATIGKMAIVTADILPANTNQACAIIRLRNNNDLGYVKYILESVFMKNYMKKCIKGSAQPNLNLQQLNDFKFPYPNEDKKIEIVSILDRFDKLCNDISEGLPAEIEARRKQYEYYRDKLLSFD